MKKVLSLMFVHKKVMLFAAVAIAVAGLSTVWAAGIINGAGATFPYPLYSKWFYSY